MRILGHPLHPLLVHFPIAFWTLGFAADCAALAGWSAGNALSGLMLALGIVTAVPAMIAGLVDMVPLRGQTQRLATIHMALMGTAWLVFVVALIARTGYPGLTAIALNAAGMLLLFGGGWAGGRLVYTHGANVSLPECSANSENRGSGKSGHCPLGAARQ